MTAVINFEAVARLRSFTAPGVELCVTQAAVSRQVKSLERMLGVSLFTRMHRSIKLTAEGELLYREVSDSLNRVSTACERLSNGAKQEQIILSTTSAFAYFRALPRSSSLHEALPQYKLRLTTEHWGSDIRKSAIDLAVRYGSGSWRDGTSTLLFDEEVFPVCAPCLLNAAAGRSLEYLIAIPLINYDAPARAGEAGTNGSALLAGDPSRPSKVPDAVFTRTPSVPQFTGKGQCLAGNACCMIR